MSATPTKRDVARTFGGATEFFVFAADHRDRRLEFAPRVTPLLDSLAASPTFDTDALLARACADSPDDPSATPYRQIRRVPPASHVTIGEDGTLALAHHAPTYFDPDVTRDPRAAADELRAAIFRAISKAVAGKKRVGVLAGGGVDSSGVLAAAVSLARGASNAEVLNVALDFAGPGDDRPYLRDLARDLGIVPIRVSPTEGAPYVRRSLVVDSLPCAGVQLGWDIALARHAHSRGAEVLLTGAGGDELFGGDEEQFYWPTVEGDAIAAASAAKRLDHRPQRPTRRWWRDRIARPLIARTAPAALRWLRRVRGTDAVIFPWAGPLLAERLATREQASVQTATTFAPSDRSFLEQLERSRLLCDVRDGAAQVFDFVPLPRADVYLDADVIDAVRATPSSYFCYGARRRGLFRLAMRGLLPESIRTRYGKASFHRAIHAMLHAAGGVAAFDDLLDLRLLAARGIVHGPTFRAHFEAAFREPDAAPWRRLWAPVALEAFLRHAAGEWSPE